METINIKELKQFIANLCARQEDLGDLIIHEVIAFIERKEKEG